MKEFQVSNDESIVWNPLAESPPFNLGATHKIESITLHDTIVSHKNDLQERHVHLRIYGLGRFQYYKRFIVFVPNHRLPVGAFSSAEISLLNKLFKPYGWRISSSRKSWIQVEKAE